MRQNAGGVGNSDAARPGGIASQKSERGTGVRPWLSPRSAPGSAGAAEVVHGQLLAFTRHGFFPAALPSDDRDTLDAMTRTIAIGLDGTSWNVLERQPFPHDLANGHNFPTNSIDELRHLAAAGIEIGAHSRTHANIGAIRDPDVLYDEVAACGDELRHALGLPIRYFAFPFGMHKHMQPAAFSLARRAGYEALCSAYGGYNYPGDDSFHLQRIGGEGPLVRLNAK